MNVFADYLQVSFADISTQDEHGADAEATGFIIPVIVPAELVGELLANYDPASGTSPGVTYSRPLSRVILDALKRAAEEP